MKHIRLTQGKSALVDDADYDSLRFWKWSANRMSGSWYAIRGTHTSNPRRSVMYLMHRVIMGCVKGDGKIVDHINGNGLDNRRQNLRVVTKGQNLQRGRSNHISKTSKYRGVSRHERKWVACITVDCKTRYLGIFRHQKAAAEAYDAAARVAFGDHARLNFPKVAKGGRSVTLKTFMGRATPSTLPELPAQTGEDGGGGRDRVTTGILREKPNQNRTGSGVRTKDGATG